MAGINTKKCCCGEGCCADSYSVTSLTRSGTTATGVTSASHFFFTGQSVTIAGADQAAYNGVKTITVVNGTTFTYVVAGSPATPATGTITASPQTCNHCPAECTPETILLDVSAINIISGCRNCPADADVRSWAVTGSFPAQALCLSRISRCSWFYRESAYTGITLKSYASADCSGAVDCTFDEFTALVSVGAGPVTNVVIGLKSTDSGCNTLLSPNTYAIIFEDVIANNTICTGSVTATNNFTTEPTGCLTVEGSRQIGYGGTADISICCEVGI